MKEKKNIDRLFQEKFKDFEHTPKEDVWKNIAEKLQEKQEKKPVILPLWYKLGGVAAVLAIILAGVYFLQNSPANFTEPQITFDIEESQLPSIKTPSDSILNTANKTLEKITETSKNSSKTTKTSITLASNISSTLTTFNTDSLGQFEGVFRHSKVTGLIDGADNSITGNITKVTMCDDLTPTIGTSTGYTIRFNNKLYNPHAGHNSASGGVISSTGFKISGDTTNDMFFDDNGSGVLRLYYLKQHVLIYI